jgi:putative transposase
LQNLKFLILIKEVTTDNKFISILAKHNIQISMDGKGRWMDNVFVERFWRSLKYENIYKKSYKNGQELFNGVKNYIKYNNDKRFHQSLNYQTPKEYYIKYLTDN